MSIDETRAALLEAAKERLEVELHNAIMRQSQREADDLAGKPPSDCYLDAMEHLRSTGLFPEAVKTIEKMERDNIRFASMAEYLDLFVDHARDVGEPFGSLLKAFATSFPDGAVAELTKQ